MARASRPRPPDLLQRVARHIAEARRERGLTQESLAQRLGMATKNLQRIESGRQNLTLRTVQSVATALELDPEALFAHAPSAPPAATARSPRGMEALPLAGVRLFPPDSRPPKGAVPIMSLRAAASRPSSATAVQTLAWALLPRRRKALPTGSFLAQVAGHSMEPTIPDGAWCLLRAPMVAPPEARVVLVQHRDITDPETGGAYAVKRFGGLVLDADGAPHVRLESINPAFKPLVIPLEQPDALRVIAEFIEVVA